MPGKFKVLDKHILFANDIAAGVDQWKAYQKHISPKSAKPTAQTKSSGLANLPPIKKLIQKAQQARQDSIIKYNAENLPEELKGVILTVEDLDMLHYNIVRGKVLVEEVIPVQTITKDERGREVSRTTSFMRVKRTPNIRERQASASEIYKRFGHYAPNKVLGAFKNMDNDGEGENIERFIMLSTGEKIPMSKT